MTYYYLAQATIVLKRFFSKGSTITEGSTNHMGLVYVDAENCKIPPQDLMNTISIHNGSKPSETYAYSNWSAKSMQTKEYRSAGFRLLHVDSGDNNADIMMCLDAYQRVRELSDNGISGNVYICFHRDKDFTHLLEKLRAINGWNSVWVTSNTEPNRMIENSASVTLRVSAPQKDATISDRGKKDTGNDSELRELMLELIGEEEIKSSTLGVKITQYQKSNGWSETGRKALNKKFGLPRAQTYRATISKHFSTEIEILGEGVTVSYKTKAPSQSPHKEPIMKSPVNNKVATISDNGRDVESTEQDEKAQLFISIDAQSLCYNYDIVALTYILKQLNLFAEKIGLQPRFETIAPAWLMKRQKYNHNDKVALYSRLVTMFIPNTDKELDDYLVVALASTNEGYYLSNDKKMHEHIGKSDEWRDLHRISFDRKLMFDPNKKPLSFPNGEISNQYNKLFEEGELKIELEEWETTIRTETIEKEKLKEEKLPKKYFCPECDEKFPKLKYIKAHRLETGHASLICDDCDEIFAVKRHKDEHEKKTGHSNYSGKMYKQHEMRILPDKRSNDVLRKENSFPKIEGFNDSKGVKGGMRFPREPEDMASAILKLSTIISPGDTLKEVKDSLHEVTGISKSRLSNIQHFSLYEYVQDGVLTDDITSSNPKKYFQSIKKNTLRQWSEKDYENLIEKYFSRVESILMPEELEEEE